MKIAIINSSGFWSMGWATDPESQKNVLNSLKRMDIPVDVYDVGSKAQLDKVLSELNVDDCLVWPNAYQVSAFEGSDDTLWLADIIEEAGFPVIGNGSATLKNVMLKDECQRILEQHGVSIPSFAAVDQETLSGLGKVLDSREMSFPLFVKPNALSTSKGVTQQSVVYNLEQLYKQVSDCGQQYGFPVMVEEYLPGQDITVAVFMAPEQPVILATYYDTEIYENPGAVLDYDIRQRDWNDGKWLRLVTEPEVLAQIESVVIPACEALGITEFTRIDCRMDSQGRLKAFDVNGLPGLELPFSTSVWQMIVKLEQYSEQAAFDTLISLIVYCAAHRHQMPVPGRLQTLAEAYITDNTVINALECQETA